MIQQRISKICLEDECDTFNKNPDQFDIKKQKQVVHAPKPVVLHEIDDIVNMKNIVPVRNQELRPIAKILRVVYPNHISSEQTCFLNSKFIVDTKDNLSNNLKD